MYFCQKACSGRIHAQTAKHAGRGGKKLDNTIQIKFRLNKGNKAEDR